MASTFTSMALFAESFKITGTVLDSVNYKPIANVNVIVDETTIGTITDDQGIFNIIADIKYKNNDIIFSHIAYKLAKRNIRVLLKDKKVYLSIKNIDLREVHVEGVRKTEEYEQDIYNIVNVIDEITFESKGFVDVADVLVYDQSVMIDENLNGKKTISVRGANEDEVLILYDGIRINNSFDNLFDLSLIDPSGLKQIDVIKGANAATLGAFSSAAVINFVPKLEQDYLFKFEQRLGSFNSGDWRLNLYKDIYGLKVFSSYKKGAATQRYVDSVEDDDIIHKSTNFNVNTGYNYGAASSENKRHELRAKYLYSRRLYDNNRYSEELESTQDIYSADYTGNYGKYGKLKIGYSTNLSDEWREWQYNYMSRVVNMISGIRSGANQISVDHSLRFSNFDLFGLYVHESSDMDYTKTHVWEDGSYDYPARYFERRKDGYLASVQFHNTAQNRNFDLSEINFYMGFENVRDQLPDLIDTSSTAVAENQNWFESSNNLSISFEGYPFNDIITGYIIAGISNTIPTLYQQFNYQLYHRYGDHKPKLMPEYKKSFEFGFSYFGEIVKEFATFQLTGSYFSNSYTNKFRTIRISQSPISYFDNHDETDIKGVESTFSIGFFDDKVKLNSALTKYFSPDERAFSYKSDEKYSTGLFFLIKELSIDVRWFYESDKVGFVLIPYSTDPLQKLSLDKYTNIDVHLKYSFRLADMTFISSFSGRNLINKDDSFEGIAIHDRRFYITFGVEFE